jgi:hypothetical protein
MLQRFAHGLLAGSIVTTLLAQFAHGSLGLSWIHVKE